jgi:hypothetical protein
MEIVGMNYMISNFRRTENDNIAALSSFSLSTPIMPSCNFTNCFVKDNLKPVPWSWHLAEPSI